MLVCAYDSSQVQPRTSVLLRGGGGKWVSPQKKKQLSNRSFFVRMCLKIRASRSERLPQKQGRKTETVSYFCMPKFDHIFQTLVCSVSLLRSLHSHLKPNWW